MSQKITLSDGVEVEISMLPLRSYGELLKVLRGLFKQIVNDWENLDENQIVEQLPVILGDHIEDAAGIISIGTRGQITTEELLDERGLADAITLFTAVLEENDVNAIVGSVKKAMAAFQAKRAQAQTPSE